MGGEGDDAGGEWFVEGLLEELDAPNEFFYDAEAKKLYLCARPGPALAAAAPPRRP